MSITKIKKREIYMESVEKEIQTKIVTGSLELLILKIINQQPTHGYQIITKIQKTFNTPTCPNTIYLILTQLEQKQYITSTWDHTTEKPRKIYTITPQGQKILETYQTTLNNFNTTINNTI